MATAADADIALKLYDLRREDKMRAARNYVAMEFWPTTVDEFSTIHQPTNPNNVYWRQCISYWEMTAVLVLHGTLDAELWADTQGEALFTRAKFADLSEQKTGNPFMPKTLAVMQKYPAIQAQYDGVTKMIAARRLQMTGKAS